MRSSKMRTLKLAYQNVLLLYFIWYCGLTLAEEEDVEVETSTRIPVKLSAVLRNISLSANLPQPLEARTFAPRVIIRRRANARIRSVKDLMQQRTNSSTPLKIESDAGSTDQSTGESFREPKSLQPVSKISGTVEGSLKNPQDHIRNALLNHTLEHGGEEDLDKLVFSNLPNGSKLVLRTVRIIRTDEDGNPMDGAEHAQPTYWDVTLANATDPHLEEESEESDESEEETDAKSTIENGNEVMNGTEIPSPVALKSTSTYRVGGPNRTNILRKGRGGRKKSDLESSGSHSAANYHLNGYGTADREKEHGTTRYHGNTHGDSHKQTHTVTDGKDIKPYHGTENGYTDHSSDHGKSNDSKGERFKSSKRKNKGRKVTGFKRVYHKEEYQRTEHFFDDEEAKKIAESFGLSDAKEADNHGTKGDKRKYHGVRTEYLDGKKHENEHGTHDGYNKGQHTTYKDNEKHRHHNNYGKSQSQSHGSSPQNHHHGGGYDYQQSHPQQQQLTDYHPNHNYHASYSNPKKSTIPQVPKSIVDQLGGTRSLAAIISAPMAHSFSVTEYSPLISSSVSTPNPVRQVSASFHSFSPSPSYDDNVNYTSPLQSHMNDNQTVSEDDISYNPERRRKRPRQRKMYFSPKYRPVEEDTNVKNSDDQLSPHILAAVPVKDPPQVTYHVASVSDIINSDDVANNEKDNGQVDGEKDSKYTPYAPNFGPVSAPEPHYVVAPPGSVGRYPKSWRWLSRGRPKRPRPMTAYSPLQMQLLTHPSPSGYPGVRNQMHLTGIPLRHASAFHRLGNRHHRYSTLKHHPKQLHPYEVSTRKSDNIEYDHDRDNATSHSENDAAHYFNHNQRYAKHHLTSTINPLKSNDNNKNNANGYITTNNGVRNTLLDPVPGIYSTVVKVFPATMLKVNDSTTQPSGLAHQHVNNNVAGHPSPSTVTQRPFNHADIISITTAFPQQLHSSQSQQQHVRPFIPRKRWLSFNFNLGNPDFKLGNEYGPSQHPFGHNSQPASYIMQGIRNGILKPFRRTHQLLASPTVVSPQSYHRQRSPLLYTNKQHVLMHPRPHPIFAHNVVSYDNFGDQSPAVSQIETNKQPSVLQSSSPMSLLLSTSPSPVIALKSGRPKFYYNYKPSGPENQTVVMDNKDRKGLVAESRGDMHRSHSHNKPIRKVAKSLTSLPTAQTSTTDVALTSTNEPEHRMSGKQPTQHPPFISGIMDSVADFFGRMG